MSQSSCPLLQVGTARVDITPPLGMYDGRYAHQVQRIDAPVFARAIYLEQPGGEDPVVLAMGDFCGMTGETDRRLRRLVGEATGVAPQRVRINASHNHTCIGGYRTTQQLYEKAGRQFLDLQWFEQTVERGFVQAAEQARDARREATVMAGSAPITGVISNRVYYDDEGNLKIRMGVTDEAGRRAPRGLFDPALYVLTFKDAHHDRPLVTVLNMACHATSLQNRGELVSPDFPGYAVNLVEQATGGPAFYLHGAGGNVGPGRDSDGSIAGAHRLARQIARAAGLALRQARPCRPAPLQLHSWTQQVKLRDDLPDEATAWADFQHYAAQPNLYSGELWRRAAMWEVVSQRDTVSQCELFVLHHGDWCLAGLPGESMVESQLALRGASPVPFTMVGSYYDTTLWYIPTSPKLRQGGYEVDSGWTYTAPGTSELLSRSIITRLGQLATDEPAVSS